MFTIICWLIISLDVPLLIMAILTLVILNYRGQRRLGVIGEHECVNEAEYWQLRSKLANCGMGYHDRYKLLRTLNRMRQYNG